MTITEEETADRLLAELQGVGVSLGAGLPDDWLVPLLARLDAEPTFTYVPVAREMEAVGVCAGAFFAGVGSVAIMGIAGLFTTIHELTTMNMAHQIPLFILASKRGGIDDLRTYQVAQGQYGLRLLDALEIPYCTVESYEQLPMIGNAYRKSRVTKRPLVAFVTKPVLQPTKGREQ